MKRKSRSTANRFQFKSLLEELNKCVSDVKLSTNNTLELAVNLTKLNSFYKDGASSSTSTSCAVSVDNFLKVSNSIGIAFLESGIIVYATDELNKYFIDVNFLVGYPLSTICFNSAQVLRSVFEDNRTEFVLKMKMNYGSTVSNDICISGKRMYSADKDAMFLGHSMIKPFSLFKNPSLAVTGCYHLLCATTFKMIQSHPFMDYLLNTTSSGTNAIMYPHPGDMPKIPALLSTLKETGFSEFVGRLLRVGSDGTTSYVHTLQKLSIQKGGRGDVRIVAISFPFAISSEGKEFSSDDFKMIQDNPEMSAAIKKQTKQYRKAVLHRVGTFSDASSDRVGTFSDASSDRVGTFSDASSGRAEKAAFQSCVTINNSPLCDRQNSAFSSVRSNCNFLQKRIDTRILHSQLQTATDGAKCTTVVNNSGRGSAYHG